MRACASSARPRLRSALSAGRTLSACSACTFKRCLVSRHWLRTRRLKMSVSSRLKGAGDRERGTRSRTARRPRIIHSFRRFQIIFRSELQITRARSKLKLSSEPAPRQALPQERRDGADVMDRSAALLRFVHMCSYRKGDYTYTAVYDRATTALTPYRRCDDSATC